VKNNKLIALLSIWLLVLTCLYLYGFTYTLDCANPVGTMAPSVLDDYARNDKYGWQERLNVEHYFALTGTQVSDAATGQHRQIEFYGPITKPTSAANKSWLYAKDVSAKTELHWEDEDGDEVQLTSGGVFNIGLLTSTTIVTPTLTTPTLTSPVINTGVSGTAFLDEDDMASNSATKLASQQSIKAYVDSYPGYSPASYTGGESATFPNGMIIKQGNNAYSGSDLTVTFSTPFPTACTRVTTSLSMTSWGTAYSCVLISKSKTNFVVSQGNGTSRSIDWIAIGY